MLRNRAKKPWNKGMFYRMAAEGKLLIEEIVAARDRCLLTIVEAGKE